MNVISKGKSLRKICVYLNSFGTERTQFKLLLCVRIQFSAQLRHVISDMYKWQAADLRSPTRGSPGFINTLRTGDADLRL